jgi:shikimate dehydrogenase
VAGILGDPVAHSRSPAIWNSAFAAAGLDWVFVAFPVPRGKAAAALDGVRSLGIAAVTVTMPHKADAAAACDDLSETAALLGAVNAIANRSANLSGDSTDGAGFVRSLDDESIDPSGRRCLVLGSGGAARAIAHALGGAGADVVVMARRREAAGTAASLAPAGRGVTFEALEDEVPAADIVVNATPLGMNGEPPPFDVAALSEGAVVADTVYHPAETPLLAAARARGLHCVGGLGMLVHQAALSFHTFTGVDAPLEVMHAAAAAA